MVRVLFSLTTSIKIEVLHDVTLSSGSTIKRKQCLLRRCKPWPEPQSSFLFRIEVLLRKFKAFLLIKYESWDGSIDTDRTSASRGRRVETPVRNFCSAALGRKAAILLVISVHRVCYPGASALGLLWGVTQFDLSKETEYYAWEFRPLLKFSRKNAGLVSEVHYNHLLKINYLTV